MIRPLAALGVAILIAASCAGGAATGAPASPAAASPAPLRVAHRGGAALAPENTLVAFRSGIAQGADALELDLHLSRDGRLVVIHDSSVDRTTDRSGLVADLSLAQLKALDAGARFKGPAREPQEIPTLEEVLALLSEAGNERIELQAEIKPRADGSRYAGIEEALVLALRSWSLADRTTVLSFDFPSLQAVKRLEPGLRACALVGKEYFKAAATLSPDRIARSLAALGVDSVGVREQNLDRGLYEALRRAGLGVGAWTVDEPTRMRQLAALGLDFITTNRPDLLRQVLP
jgi:glycerophosphoryl diester phosphodiesterase